jgi:hypothetical protein
LENPRRSLIKTVISRSRPSSELGGEELLELDQPAARLGLSPDARHARADGGRENLNELGFERMDLHATEPGWPGTYPVHGADHLDVVRPEDGRRDDGRDPEQAWHGPRGVGLLEERDALSVDPLEDRAAELRPAPQRLAGTRDDLPAGPPPEQHEAPIEPDEFHDRAGSLGTEVDTRAGRPLDRRERLEPSGHPTGAWEILQVADLRRGGAQSGEAHRPGDGRERPVVQIDRGTEVDLHQRLAHRDSRGEPDLDRLTWSQFRPVRQPHRDLLAEVGNPELSPRQLLGTHLVT